MPLKYTLTSDDEKKSQFNFLFELKKDKNNEAITVEAKENVAQNSSPKVFRNSITKETFKMTFDKLSMSNPNLETIMQEIEYSHQINQLKFALKKSEITLSFFIYGRPISLPIPLLESRVTGQELRLISSRLSYLNEILNRYKCLIKKLTNIMNKKGIQIENQSLDKPTLINLLSDHNNQITQKLTFIEGFISQETTRKNKFVLVKDSTISLHFEPAYTKLEVTKTIEVDKSIIYCLCFLRDMRLVSSSRSDDNKTDEIKVYSNDTYKPEVTIKNPHKGSLSSICGLRNGYLASSGDNIKIWEINKGDYKSIHTISSHSGSVHKIIELTDGKLCSCSSDETVRIWDTEYKCAGILKGHTNWVISILEMDNAIISSSSFYGDTTVRIWDKSKYKNIKVLNRIYCYSTNSLSKLKDDLFILGGKNEIFIVNVSTFQVDSFKNEKLGDIYSIFVLKNDKVLLGNSKGMIISFDSLSNQFSSFIRVHGEKVYCLIESKDHQIFSSSYNEINIYSKFV